MPRKGYVVLGPFVLVISIGPVESDFPIPERSNADVLDVVIPALANVLGLLRYPTNDLLEVLIN